MLLTLSTTQAPATDLGYLLHKNPARVQSFTLSFGQAHVYYPRADQDCCTAALLLEVDPVGLVRGRGGSSAMPPLQQYVNDRPYVASSFLSVAIAQVYGSALSGTCKARPKLCESTIPLRANITALPCRGGEAVLRRLFEPLGYEIDAERQALDDRFPEWGESRLFNVSLKSERRLQDLLSHLYVLIPVLDDEKHYWVGEDEVEKLLRRGAGWLESHPEREMIAFRYLRHRRSLAQSVIDRLMQDDLGDPEPVPETRDDAEAIVERRISLNEQRIGAVVSALRESGAARVLDLGCGEGQLIRALIPDRRFTEIAGMDVSHRCLEITSDRLKLDRMPERERSRIRLFQGSLMYRDARLAGYGAAAVVEVVEHLDPPRLAAFERVLFEYARPGTAVVTTPNVEYNVRFENLPAGKLRHRDHRFEWTRSQFREWSNGITDRFGYTVRYQPIGPDDPEVGSPTQMAVFTRS